VVNHFSCPNKYITSFRLIKNKKFVVLLRYSTSFFFFCFVLQYHILFSLFLLYLVHYLAVIVGIRIDSLDQLSLEKIGRSSTDKSHSNTEPESCPFSWARSPENLLRQETYLALATTFVVLRLLYSFFPTLLICIQFAWRRVIQNIRLGSLLEHPLIYLKRLIQSFNCLKEPCKRSNLQEGAMNARAWASKSLATVSIGEESSSRGMHQWVDFTERMYLEILEIWLYPMKVLAASSALTFLLTLGSCAYCGQLCYWIM